MQNRCFFSKPYTIVVIYLLSSVFFSSYGSLLLKSAQASVSWGSEVGEFTGVKAYSNGFTHDTGYKDEDGNWHSYPIAYGCFQYQCVEYINHFYDKIFNMTLGTGHGRNYYIRASDKGLDRYVNGGDVIPRIGDVLCFDDSHSDNPGEKNCSWNEESEEWECEKEAFGHVAIIRNVGSNNIEVIQQNWYNDFEDEHMSIVYSNTSNKINSLGNYVVQGWLRKPGITQLTSEFTTEGYTEGWMTFNLEVFSVNNLDPDRDGVFCIDPGVSDPYIVSPPLIVNSVEYDAVEIMMASNAPDGSGAIYFTTVDSPWWSEDKKVGFSVINDSNYHKYSIAMTNNLLWAGTITGIRIDPSDHGIGDSNEDTIGFDYIRIVSYSATRTMDFEDGADRQPIQSKIPGMVFTTTDGYNWIYGDWRTNGYNGPYPNGMYFSNGNFFAWLGENQGTGRIDFTGATATYLSVLTSTYSGLTMDAYDKDNVWLADSGWADNNLSTGEMTRLTVSAPNMAYVLVHDTGNYWLIDDLEIGDLLAKIKAYLPTSFLSEYEDLDTLNQDQEKWKVFFNENYQTIKIILGWDGSELSIQIYKPNGDLYGEYQSDKPPIIIDIPGAEQGEWQFKITAIDVPENNYPFALVVGIPDDTCPNTLPIADAGPDQIVTVDINCMAIVVLDGCGSFDPDGDPLTYTWTWDGESTTGVSPTIQLPLGTTSITLVVNDGTLDSDPDTVDINVVDDTPPETSLSVSPDTLWPPNHKMMLITPIVIAADNCDPNPTITLQSITMNEGEETNTYDPNYDSIVGDGNTFDDIQVDENGDIYLRAERSGTGTGRIYTITYSATDASGNSSTASATVAVPHNQ